ncbi:iron chelate uptake ABC transporter family permease subunit, partial [Geminicoccus flavidas]|uniref:iron chelate uptake ABC transporter family permease subunit n=1 Tax=Geminicoccus flavidas TaxID=2506407 RepID=UPI0013582F0F
AASVTALVGVIGFVGLAAPAFTRLSGLRGQRQALLAAPILGGVILWLSDGIVQLLSDAGSDLVPTGAATGLLGGPLLLWLLPRLPIGERPPLPPAPVHLPRRERPWRTMLWLLLAVAGLVLACLVLGRSHAGWQLATGSLFADLLPFRLPRVAAALAAGALLGAAGTLLQRLTGNPMASPEVLGVSAGAGAGLGAVLLLATVPGPALLLTGSACGSLLALMLILAFGARSGFGPERLLLAGVAIGAACLAMMTAVLATGTAQSFTLLVWMTGSTDRLATGEALVALLGAILLILPLPFLSRWLDILPLGG